MSQIKIYDYRSIAPTPTAHVLHNNIYCLIGTKYMCDSNIYYYIGVVKNYTNISEFVSQISNPEIGFYAHTVSESRFEDRLFIINSTAHIQLYKYILYLSKDLTVILDKYDKIIELK
ncbi:MAG: hypothetical protein LC122_12270 [Chitinophagales bacterium]|nr:hypothetical protein [Chitinophagales bacterium]